MRHSRILLAICLGLLAGAIPATANPHSHSALLVEPWRGDFDNDGRADVASVEAGAERSTLRITLSRSGVRELGHAGWIQAIAGIDFDHDGDIDLLVGTSEGAVVWLNDGRGIFVRELLQLAATPDDSA